MANWRRITGAAGLAVGATAATAGAVVAAERIAISRLRGTGGNGAETFGSLRGLELTVLADDGVPLHVEINDPAPDTGRPGSRCRQPGGRHDHLLPRLHGEPGLLALPAPRPRRPPAGLLGPARPRPVRALRPRAAAASASSAPT